VWQLPGQEAVFLGKESEVRRTKVEVVGRTKADWNHEVVSVKGGGGSCRKVPCPTCPWTKAAAIGEFPAEAFRISAHTAYDMAPELFACHQSGAGKPAACAGFIVSGGRHNLGVRLGQLQGRYLDVSDGGRELYESYRAMAVANGVDPDDPVLTPCRDD
jgi:hypothetical protein